MNIVLLILALVVGACFGALLVIVWALNQVKDDDDERNSS